MTLTFLITDLHRGGSPLLLADLAPGLAQASGQGRWDVEVVSIAPPPPSGEIAELLEARGIPVTSLNARFNRDLSVLPRFIRHLRARRPDIVCSILVHANLLASMAQSFVPEAPRKTLWVQSIHTLQEKPRWHWTLQSLLCPRADAFIAPSQAILDRLLANGPVPNPAVIPNGIDVRRFHSATPIDNPPWPKDARVVGYIGRLDPVKNIPLLIQSLPHLPDNFHLALLGTGPEEKNLRRLANTLTPAPTPAPPIPNSQFPIPLPSRIHFLGSTTTPERWYKTFHVFCSLSAEEGFGLTLAEAASAGIPVVASDSPAARQTLPEAFWVSPQATPAQVAQRLLDALSKPPLHGAASELPASVMERQPGVAGLLACPAGQQLALLEKRYSIATMVESYAAHFSNYLASRAGTREPGA